MPALAAQLRARGSQPITGRVTTLSAAHVVVPTAAPNAKPTVAEAAEPLAEDETSTTQVAPGIDPETDAETTKDEWSGEKDW